jgi:hypothetical protein
MMLALLAIAPIWFTPVAGTPDYKVLPHLLPGYYDTLDEAGIAGIEQSYVRSQFYEFGGVIVKTTNGKYRISVPETDYAGDSVQISARFHMDYAGYFTVADYHTHTCLPYSHFPAAFSDADVRINTHDGSIGYMGNLCTGDVLRFVPGVTPENKCFPGDEEPDGDFNWDTLDIIVFAGAPPKLERFCGSYGEHVGKIELTYTPVMVERPGPQALKRGVLK